MFLSFFEGSQTTKQGSKRASGKTMEAQRVIKTPNPTDRKAVHSLPCSLRGALLVLSSVLLLSWGLWLHSGHPGRCGQCGPSTHPCPRLLHFQLKDSLSPLDESPSLMQNSVGWHFLPCQKQDRGLFSNSRSLNSFSFSRLRSALQTFGVWTHRPPSIAWVPI